MASTSATVNGWRARASKTWYPTDGSWKSDGSSTGINVSISDPTGNNKYGVIIKVTTPNDAKIGSISELSVTFEAYSRGTTTGALYGSLRTTYTDSGSGDTASTFRTNAIGSEASKTGISTNSLSPTTVTMSFSGTLSKNTSYYLFLYALNLFGIREMFRSKNQDLPIEIDPYIQQHTETVAARDWGATVTESFCDSTRVMVTVSVTGGDKYIVVPTDATPEHSVSVIGIDGDETLGEYAAAQGKELLCVSASLRQNEELGIFTEAMTFVNFSDSQMCILVDSTRSNGAMIRNAFCWVYAVNAAGERIDTLQIPIELAEAPVTEAGSFVPDNPNAIPGLTVHSVSVEETPLGWTVRFISSITDDVAFENFKRMDCDELTDFDGGGFVLEDDGTWSTTWTMGKGNISDTLTVHFYDWDDQLIGDIVFKK